MGGMKTNVFLFAFLAAASAVAASAALPSGLEVDAGDRLVFPEPLRNFELRGEFLTDPDAEAAVGFHCPDEASGYEVLFRNGPVDGTRKSGSLSHVRNLYRSLAADGVWSGFSIDVRGKTVEVRIRDVPVVRYAEPADPWRSAAHRGQRFGRGGLTFAGVKGRVRFRNLVCTPLPDDARPAWPVRAPVDERTDRAIRLQQRDFPVIDWHVHLKGGLTRAEAFEKSQNYGINYGVAPNLGEGGVGEMFLTDAAARGYLAEARRWPFLCSAQGEGRRWAFQFAPSTFAAFDCLFTDSMTVVDGGRPLRIYRADEFNLNGRTEEEWMDFLVSQIENILAHEPVDIYANATFLPEPLQPRYEELWTAPRVKRVLDTLARYGIALEISARYKIPSLRIISAAKARGIKFTFGTNNEKSEFGRLEYALDAAEKCGLTKEDMWFPSLSVRAARKAVPWNTFGVPPAAGPQGAAAPASQAEPPVPSR